MRAEDILPDQVNSSEMNGILVRKGTVGAFLANARIIKDPEADDRQRTLARQHMADLIPALQALGLFEFFALKDDDLRSFVAARIATEKSRDESGA
jgi:hypothetical protein